MSWTFLFNPRFWLALILTAAFSGAAGYTKGTYVERRANEARQNKALVEAQAKASEIEHAKNAEMQGIANDYETKLGALSVRAAAAERDLGRLRVRARSDNRLSTTAAAPCRSDAAAANGALGVGEGEINLDGPAAEIVRLGRDLDAANLRIIELQALIRSYSETGKK